VHLNGLQKDLQRRSAFSAHVGTAYELGWAFGSDKYAPAAANGHDYKCAA